MIEHCLNVANYHSQSTNVKESISGDELRRHWVGRSRGRIITERFHYLPLTAGVAADRACIKQHVLCDIENGRAYFLPGSQMG
ncbi:hypothetical protein EGR_09947 [Echinococcus granulosus]|uniref:Uncharacterized protein n=1 Tax=Echinococcus granulosus TaxID=6210 RepID=W6UP32_ECHGR|nr:hypothetical protein EGR_09947 [Echinococcus granulosus]EUB55184.1 hypothetical protein EGR_09947 [Echinococcus granulosus]